VCLSGVHFLTISINSATTLKAPTLITQVDDTFSIVTEEQFGPALPILTYTDLDDAVRRANDCNVGLGGSVWGNDTAAAAIVASSLQSGTAWVNQHKVMTPAAPFGGLKQSGVGRENGQAGLLGFLEREHAKEPPKAK
jgi:acyl-CoA reductase-like NAD-dependent aldehyde dehydrogenase